VVVNSVSGYWEAILVGEGHNPLMYC
jgi:hypothetical protein